MKPSVGRTVHYITAKKSHRPAIITHVWEDGSVSLHIMTVPSLDFMGSHDLDKVVYRDEKDGLAGTWHWPEREAGP